MMGRLMKAFCLGLQCSLLDFLSSQNICIGKCLSVNGVNWWSERITNLPKFMCLLTNQFFVDFSNWIRVIIGSLLIKVIRKSVMIHVQCTLYTVLNKRSISKYTCQSPLLDLLCLLPKLQLRKPAQHVYFSPPPVFWIQAYASFG